MTDINPAEAMERLTEVANYDRRPEFTCCAVRVADLRVLLAECNRLNDRWTEYQKAADIVVRAAALLQSDSARAQAAEARLAALAGGEGGQDRKFKFENGQFVNRVSGEAIPLDEPVIIFRARDKHSLGVLEHYRGLATDPHHQQAIDDRIQDFGSWRELNADRLKGPGITRHIRIGRNSGVSTPLSISAGTVPLW